MFNPCACAPHTHTYKHAVVLLCVCLMCAQYERSDTTTVNDTSQKDKQNEPHSGFRKELAMRMYHSRCMAFHRTYMAIGRNQANYTTNKDSKAARRC